MKKLKILTIAALAIIWTGCNKGNENTKLIEINLTDKAYQISFKKIDEIRIETISKSYPYFKKVISDNHLYITHPSWSKDLEISIYNMDLELSDTHKIKYGQGPNECISPRIFGGTEDNIIVYDGNTQRYYLYDREFGSRVTIQSSMMSENVPYYGHMYYPPEGIVLVSTINKLDDSRTSHFKIYTRKIVNGKFKDQIVYNRITAGLGYKTNPRRLMAGDPHHFKLVGNHLYVLELDNYKLIKMDLSGKVAKAVKINNIPDISFSKKELDKWMSETILPPNRFTYPEKLWTPCWMIKILDGIAVGRRKNYSSQKVDDWIEADYFDLDLNFKGKIKLPWFSRWNRPGGTGQQLSEMITHTKDNLFFLIERRDVGDDEEYYLSKWEIR